MSPAGLTKGLTRGSIFFAKRWIAGSSLVRPGNDADSCDTVGIAAVPTSGRRKDRTSNGLWQRGETPVSAVILVPRRV